MDQPNFRPGAALLGAALFLSLSVPANAQVTTVVTNTLDWALSTVRTSGGSSGIWTFLPNSLPATASFTLTLSARE
ncbi:MAG: hypothetical protein R3D58_02310 [Saprospiraceae bacterium]|nr:hypothetical protein [Lewinellaceae bacterium]